MGGSSNGKTFFSSLGKGIERNANALFRIVLRQDLYASDGRHDSCNSLLPVDKYLLANSRLAVFQLDVGVLPNDQITSRISVVQRVN